MNGIIFYIYIYLNILCFFVFFCMSQNQGSKYFDVQKNLKIKLCGLMIKHVFLILCFFSFFSVFFVFLDETSWNFNYNFFNFFLRNHDDQGKKIKLIWSSRFFLWSSNWFEFTNFDLILIWFWFLNPGLFIGSLNLRDGYRARKNELLDLAKDYGEIF